MAGPLRCRHQSTARVIASYDSSGSLPSTSSTSKFGKLPTSFETEPPAVCTSMGTEIAYLLSSMRKRTGSLRLLALLSASHHSPSLVVPSISGSLSSDRKSTRLNSSHSQISYAVFCLKKNNAHTHTSRRQLTAPARRSAHHDDLDLQERLRRACDPP